MSEISVCSRKGRRDSMEDTHVIETDLMQDGSRISLFAVFDGHRGKYTALYLQNSYASVLRDCIEQQRTLDPNEVHYESALRNSFELCEEGATLEYEARSNDESAEWNVTGSTAAVVLFVDHITIYCANAGDSEVVVGRKNMTHHKKPTTDAETKEYLFSEYVGVCLSTLHKPDTDSELARIKRAGGFVSKQNGGVARVGGHPRYVNLSVSRSFGNSDLVGYKTKEPLISARPDIAKTDIRDGDVLIVACDGLWDVYDYKDAVKDAYEYHHNGVARQSVPMPNAAEYLATRAIDVLKTEDNVTVIVAFLSVNKSKEALICESIEPESESESTADDETNEE